MFDVILDILVEIYILFDIFSKIITEKADIWDYIYLVILGVGLAILAYMKIKEEIKIRKKMKEIREAREEKKSSE